MGNSRLERVDSNVDKGIETFSPEFSPIMHFTENTYNVTQGIKHGVGPRFGISPIPGHNHTDDTSTEPVGLMQAEADGTNWDKRPQVRQKFFGFVPFSFKKYDTNVSAGFDFAARGDYKTQFMVWMTAEIDNNVEYLDLFMLGDYAAADSTFFYFKSDIAAGILPAAYFNNSGSYAVTFDYIEKIAATIKETYSPPTKYYAKTAELYVKTPRLKFNWIIGAAKENVAEDSLDLILASQVMTGFASGKCGYIPSFATGTFDKQRKRTITFYTLYDAGTTSELVTLARAYKYFDAVPVSNNPNTVNEAYSNFYRSVGNQKSTSFDGFADAVRTRVDGGAAGLGNEEVSLLHDPMLESETSYIMFFMAADKAYAIMAMDSMASSGNMPHRYIDLSFIASPPANYRTMADHQNAAVYYSEGTDTDKSTCFHRWPPFVRGTALAKDSATAYDGYHQVTLGEANSGVLRKNTVYEITFSIFDKVLNFETNVGAPAKIQTGADDNIALSMFRDAKSGANWLQRCALSPSAAAGNNDYYEFRVMDILVNTFEGLGVGHPLNHKELRVYYREEGSYEWLPALQIDASKYYGYPDHTVLWACQAPIASLPGGQPGGFNDYSPLPVDKFIDVMVFRDRVFWLSKDKMVYSYRKNSFCYAGRNSVAVPTGEFRGFKKHAYPGQSNQNSRIIIFGSQETYIGRFTGNPEVATVVVSPDTIGQYPVDGSDFDIDVWTSYTSFSGRSAVVANGILYYWGEKGIFADFGATLPERISGPIEPHLHDLYDPNKIDEVFAHYFDATKEIYWFYPPSRDNTITDAVIFNTQTNEFMFARFAMKIDSIQDVPITNTDTDRDTNGLRAVISARKDSSETTQRGYFFDVRNRAGDMRPETELLVKTVATPAAGTRRLTLAGGFDAANLATVAVGDLLTIQQGADYSDDSDIIDLVGKISAVGANYVDFTLPSGATTFKGALSPTTDKYFPIWIDRLNQFPYYIETNYWTPRGLNFWAFWHYIHALFNITLLPAADGPQLTLQYRTPIADALVSNVLEMEENSDGHYQVITQLKSDRQSFEGQSLKWIISGNHNAHKWVLQYLGADIDINQGQGALRHFEG